MREIWIIGNGFNKALASNLHFASLSAQLEKISTLWGEFNDVLDSFKSFFEERIGGSLTDEQVLEILFDSLGLFSLNAERFGLKQECEDCLELYEKEIEEAVLAKLVDIAVKFLKLEQDGLYGEISKMEGVKNFLEYWYERNIDRNLLLLTLNYDGIVDTLFGRKPGGGFFMRDFFRSCGSLAKIGPFPCPSLKSYVDSLDPQNKWRGIGYCFTPDALFETAHKGENLLLHVHGSYKFWRTTSSTELKIDKGAISSFIECLAVEKLSWLPIVVFGPPASKLDVINRYRVLELQWDFLNWFISSSRDQNIKLVLWGTRLTADPHLRKAVVELLIKAKGVEMVILLKNEERAKSLYEELIKQAEVMAGKKVKSRFVDYESHLELKEVVSKI